MKKFLAKFDGLWALPLSFLLFVLVGYLMPEQAGSYDLAFIQPLFLAVGIVIGATNAAVWGLYFTFRDLYKLIYKKEGREAFNNLPILQKTIISLTVLFIKFFAILFIYSKLI